MKGTGGIILIGVAVFLLVIGATDKVQEVWDAIRGVTGNIPGGPNLPDLLHPGTDSGKTDGTKEPPSNPNCVEGEMKVLPVSGDVPYCCPKAEVGASASDSECPRGYVKVTYSAMPNTAAQYGCVRLQNCHLQGSGAGYGKMNVALLPTGLTGFRYVPNI